MKKKMILGIFLGILLIYLSVKDIRLFDVFNGFRTIRYVYLFPALLIMFIMQVLRSFRWGIILEPLEKIDQFSLFSVTSVGFLGIIAIPARLGELVRPYLITNKSHIQFSSAIGTIFVERILDSITILFIFFCLLFFVPTPSWLLKSGLILFLILLIILAGIFLTISRQHDIPDFLTPVLNKIPPHFTLKLKNLIHRFIDGFKIMNDPRRLVLSIVLSIIIWIIDAMAIYILFLAFRFQLPIADAFILMVILIIGIAIPAAPGFIGNWHFFCVLGLSLFGIPKAEALSFAVIYHFLSIGIIIVLGLLFLPFNKFSFSDLGKLS
jgi:uncharacterized protein (TIRG00374 family)